MNLPFTEPGCPLVAKYREEPESLLDLFHYPSSWLHAVDLTKALNVASLLRTSFSKDDKPSLQDVIP
jgi:hypothetical protein